MLARTRTPSSTKSKRAFDVVWLPLHVLSICVSFALPSRCSCRRMRLALRAHFCATHREAISVAWRVVVVVVAAAAAVVVLVAVVVLQVRKSQVLQPRTPHHSVSVDTCCVRLVVHCCCPRRCSDRCPPSVPRASSGTRRSGDAFGTSCSAT